MSHRFEQTFVAQRSDIDELGHVNNTVWIRWVQEIATAHWRAVATPEQVEQFVWVVTRHEIDYRGNVSEGAVVRGETWIPGTPKGARFDRCVDFHDAAGKLLVAVRSTWAMLDRASGRLVRIRPEVSAPFVGEGYTALAASAFVSSTSSRRTAASMLRPLCLAS